MDAESYSPGKTILRHSNYIMLIFKILNEKKKTSHKMWAISLFKRLIDHNFSLKVT